MAKSPQDERLDHLDEMIRSRGIVTADRQRIVSPKGREQSWLIDLRPILLNGRALSAIAQIFWERFAAEMPFQICGLESACIPLLSAIVLEAERRHSRLNAFVIRKERKTSGLARDIEGDITGDRVIVIDDLTNSSASLEKVRAVLDGYGKSIDRVFVVVDFEARRSKDWRRRHGITVSSLFNSRHFGLSNAAPDAPLPAHHFDPLWSCAADGANHHIVAPRSTPVCDERYVYVGTDGGELRAMDVRTGGIAWTFKAEGSGRKGIWSSPALTEGRIVFGAYNGAVYCLDAATGGEVWRFEGADWVGSSPVVSRRHGLVLIGLEHEAAPAMGSVAALDLRTGTLVWEYRVTDYIHCTPALSAGEDRVVIGTNGGELLGLDVASGARLWQYRADAAIKAAPALSEDCDIAVAGSFDECVHLVRLSTGQPVATVRTAGKLYSTAFILGELAYIGSQDKTLYVIDLIDGSVVKTFPLGGRIYAAPVLRNGIIFVGTTAGRLFGIDPVSLTIRDELQLPDRILNPPALTPDRGTLLVPVFGNRLFAFRMEEITDTPAGIPDDASPRPESLPPATVPTPVDIDASYAEGTYFRIREPVARPLARPFMEMPSRRMVGAATLLMARSPGHQTLTFAEMEKRLLPPLRLNQARVFLQGLQPVGLVTWACLDRETEARLLAEAELPKPEDWSAGDRIWIIDVIAPFGNGRAMLDKVRREAFPGRPAGMLQPRRGGGHDVVTLPPS
ncbi:PQQ-binding-like beta-propeller repeat protein [Azospirillum sp. A26]|uniref:toxin-activating lysine-acyltransferase n=1 Tax=Azospirillum sp. A26 TaxID=3160607 RepID=UPI00366EAD51